MSVDPQGGIRRTRYDLGGRPVAAIDPLGQQTRVAYDPYGRPAKVTDPLGNATSLVYDAQRRLVALERQSRYTGPPARRRCPFV